MVGVHPQTITQLEHNSQKTFRPSSFKILIKISECLNVDWRLLADDYVLSIYGDFSERIKQYMDKNNMSQIELSRQLSVHPQTIAIWIKNKDKPSRKSWELMRKYNIV
ncbi:MAG: helix-turn-helix domain-containing protein [Oscillospiraceae bacterium]